MGVLRENKEEVLEALKSLGLTKYEALVYIALLQIESATATELHEISGVPRASVYPVLDKLMQKSLVILSNTTPKRFSATPPHDAVGNLLGSIEKNAEFAKTALNKIYSEKKNIITGNQEFIWSIFGDENIRARLIEIISDAKEEIKMLSYWEYMRKEILGTLENLEEGVKTRIISNNWEGEKPENFEVTIFTDPLGLDLEMEGEASGVYIIDNKKVMVVMNSPDKMTSALYSESDGFIHFFQSHWHFVNTHITESHNTKILP
ncbi:TrmB family transcriptional regulator [Methanoplanus sp. FWC-SCC4]|uniref:TrmB family transcriptional regulator n=2 Tax=Methanochimaera problematica TaxID=2609417 RepID=A0AA97F9B6_9EURY|nr:TrmB family transcriptional regulator [Methanoplanus sp. FWC-SCC4]